MAVQVPKTPELNRFEPQQSVTGNRLNVQTPNFGADQNRVLQTAINVGEDQVKYFEKQENNAIDTAAKAAQNEYSIYLNQELNAARQYQGDPTSAYARFDENRAKKYEEILNKNPDISERGKNAIAGSLAEVATSYQMKRDTAYSSQYYDYDSKVTNDAAQLTSQDLMTASSYVKPGDENSFKSIDALINRIDNLYKTHGEKFGEVYRDENGNQIANGNIKLKVGKTVSDGLVAAVDNLNNSGHPEIAEALYAKYYDYFDVHKRDNVVKNIKNEKRTIDVLNVVPETIGKTPEQIDKILDARFKDDPVGKDKAYQAIDSRSRRMDNISDRIAEKAYSRSYDAISKAMNSSTPYVNEFDIENDPIVKREWNKLKPAQKEALKKAVNQPKESNQTVKNNFFRSFADGELQGMTPEKLGEITAGLNKADRTKADNLWKKLNSPQTTAEEIRMMNNISNKLVPQLQAVGYVKKNSFNKYSNADQIKITEAQDELLKIMEELPPNTSYKDQLEAVKQFAAAKKKGEVFRPADTTSTPQSSGTSTKTASPFANVQQLDAGVDRQASARLFYKKYKRAGTTQELNDFIKNGNK